ncbi:RNA 2',3'-cyclic phosphodiesterase [bioreactor metagenome]|uniref:RNA 2',3'-cyclic phosphodiesterase n=1 Tax=bioreactor metagenome TaxID=1076179 RepID=A0A644VUV4_9ZZZZ
MIRQGLRMRLFIAINFSGEVKQKLVELQEGLRENSLGGNFSTYENLHLTLVFLGEVAASRVGAVRKAMDNAAFSPFRLSIRGVGSFSRNGGDILWAGIDAGRSLTGLQSRLSSQIALAGFELEKRNFKPHLTLAREVRLRADFDRAAFSRGINTISTEVSKISLMKSERLGGKLTYTEIYSVSGTPAM